MSDQTDKIWAQTLSTLASVAKTADRASELAQTLAIVERWERLRDTLEDLIDQPPTFSVRVSEGLLERLESSGLILDCGVQQQVTEALTAWVSTVEAKQREDQG